MRSVGRASGGGQSSTSPSKALGQAVDAESVISEQLLIYRNVEELQAQNQKLLAVVRQVRFDLFMCKLHKTDSGMVRFDHFFWCRCRRLRARSSFRPASCILMRYASNPMRYASNPMRYASNPMRYASVRVQLSEEHERESSEAKAQLRQEFTGKVEAALSEVEAIREQRVELEQRLHQVKTYMS
jgi:hypothetical protein